MLSEKVIQGQLTENMGLGLRIPTSKGAYGNKIHPGEGWLSYHDYDENGEYIANVQTKTYHLPTCKHLKKATLQNKNLIRTNNYKERYTPCRHCQKEEYIKRTSPEWLEKRQYDKGRQYIQHKESGVLHYSDCYHTYQMNPENKTYTSNPSGYSKCSLCQPRPEPSKYELMPIETRKSIQNNENEPINKKWKNIETSNKSKQTHHLILKDKPNKIPEFNEKEYEKLIEEIKKEQRDESMKIRRDPFSTLLSDMIAEDRRKGVKSVIPGVNPILDTCLDMIIEEKEGKVIMDFKSRKNTRNRN